MNDVALQHLRNRRRIARRDSDRLMVAYVSFAMAEERLDTARDHLEMMIIDYHNDGTTVSEIAHRTHQSRAAIYKILHKHNALDPNTHKEDEHAS